MISKLFITAFVASCASGASFKLPSAEQSHLAQIILPEQLLALNSQQPGVPQQSEDNQLVQVLTPEDLLTLQQNAAALQLMEELAPAELQQNKDNKFFFSFLGNLFNKPFRPIWIPLPQLDNILQPTSPAEDGNQDDDAAAEDDGNPEEDGGAADEPNEDDGGDDAPAEDDAPADDDTPADDADADADGDE